MTLQSTSEQLQKVSSLWEERRNEMGKQSSEFEKKMIDKIAKMERKIWKQHVDMNILENEKQELSLQLEILLLRSDYTVSAHSHDDSLASISLSFHLFFLYFSSLSPQVSL